MQLFHDRFNGEYGLNNPTKCLYTAVLVLSIYLGDYSLDHVHKCDVDHVQSYYREMQNAARVRNPKSIFDPSSILLKECERSIFSKVSGRYLYYLMMTNADVSDGKSSQSFPGHVCVLEKVATDQFYIYQSYINNYTLKDYYKMNNGFVVSSELVKNIFTELKKLFSEQGVWTSDTSNMWKKFTMMSGKEFEGKSFKGVSFFCYRKIRIDTCSNRLSSILKKSLKDGKIDLRSRVKLEKLLGILEKTSMKS